MKLVTVEEMKQMEAWADAHGYSYEMMMLRAGNELAKIVHLRYFDKSAANGIVGLVGGGNNGGDTLVALSSLCTLGWSATAVLFKSRPETDKLMQAFVGNGGIVLDFDSKGAERKIKNAIESARVILDGVMGTGARLPLAEDISGHLADIRKLISSQVVTAVDCPSGVDCDSGECSPEVIDATLTVCMDSVKQGLVRVPAFLKCGEIITVDLGIPRNARMEWSGMRQVADDEMASSMLPPRPRDAHKGSFGTVMVVGGSVNFTGAPTLAAKAAYRVGAGLVELAVPASIQSMISSSLLEAIWLLLDEENGVISESAAELVLSRLDKVSVLVLGPGIGRDETTGRFIESLLPGGSKKAAKSRGFLPGEKEHAAVGGNNVPFVIDADGLRILAAIPNWSNRLPATGVLTPHPGEMAALTGLSVGEIQMDREAIALKYAVEWNQVVILKGALTVIAEPGGRSVIIPAATSALAKAGTGDVLSGMVGGLIAQGASCFDAAVDAAWYHAQAGRQAALKLGSERAVMAGDVIDALAGVLE